MSIEFFSSRQPWLRSEALRQKGCAALLALLLFPSSLLLAQAGPGDTAAVPIQVYARTSTSLGLIWEAPSAKVDHYLLYSSTAQVGIVSANAYGLLFPDFTVAGLKPDTEYSLQVQPISPSGDRLPALNVTAKTLAQSRVINVRESPYNAKGDGIIKDSAAIQKAIDDCPPDGIVLLPPGTYYSAPLSLKSHMTLEIEKGAALLGSRDKKDYPVIDSRWEGLSFRSYKSLITAEDAEDLRIVGQGRVDGNAGVSLDGQSGLILEKKDGSGAKAYDFGLWWDHPKALNPAAEIARPRTIQLIRCKNVLIQGLTILNSPAWTIHPLYSSDLVLSGLHVMNPNKPKDSPNTDGLDPDSVRNLLVVATVFDVGDDCIAIKSGKDVEARAIGKPSSNLVIRDCIMLHGHSGITIGSEMSGGVSGLVARDCVFDGTAMGIKIKTLRGRGGLVDNASFSNILMKDVVSDAFSIDTNYSANGTPLPFTGVVDESTPHVRNIRFSAIHGSVQKEAGFFQGLEEAPLESIALADIDLRAGTGFFARFVQNGSLEKVSLGGAKLFQEGSGFSSSSQ